MFQLHVRNQKDLSRQVVRSEYADVKIPEIELEIPHGTSGTVTTVEGILKRTIEGLSQDQPVRKHMDPEGAAQIDKYISKIEDQLITLETDFHLIITDPSGNSFIENPHAPKSDPNTEVQQFSRTKEQDHSIGIYDPEELKEDVETNETTEATTESTTLNDKDVNLVEEVLSFPTNCPDCNAPATTNMKVGNQSCMSYLKQIQY